MGTAECIEKMEVSIACARWLGIRGIPNDWTVQAVSPSSERSEFKAESGHGSTAVWNFNELRRIIELRVVDPACFDIEARVYVEDRDTGRIRVVVFTKQQIKLVR